MNIPKVKDCIAYIESCGWMFQHQACGCYLFRHATRTPHELAFSLAELREAKRYGF